MVRERQNEYTYGHSVLSHSEADRVQQKSRVLTPSTLQIVVVNPFFLLVRKVGNIVCVGEGSARIN